MKKDMIDHPPHYAEGRKHEPIEVIEDWGLDFNLGTALKYIARAGRKDDIIMDLEKCVWYVQREIRCIKAQREFEMQIKLRKAAPDEFYAIAEEVASRPEFMDVPPEGTRLFYIEDFLHKE